MKSFTICLGLLFFLSGNATSQNQKSDFPGGDLNDWIPFSEFRVAAQKDAKEALRQDLDNQLSGMRPSGHAQSVHLWIGPPDVGQRNLLNAFDQFALGGKHILEYSMRNFSQEWSVSSIQRICGGYAPSNSSMAIALHSNPDLILHFDQIELAHKKVIEVLGEKLLEGNYKEVCGTKIYARTEKSRWIFSTEVGKDLIESQVTRDQTSNACRPIGNYLTKPELLLKDDCLLSQDNLKKVLIANLKEHPNISQVLADQIDPFEVTVFYPLKKEEVKLAAKLEMRAMQKDWFQNDNIELRSSDEVYEYIASSYNPKTGLYDVRDVVYREIQAALARKLLFALVEEKKSGTKVFDQVAAVMRSSQLTLITNTDPSSEWVPAALEVGF